jgi:hypothetical protein
MSNSNLDHDDREQKEAAFWRRLILPEEDKDRPWDGIGYRWFRSKNVVPLEQYRRDPSTSVHARPIRDHGIARP